jgi:phosphoribosylamine-glycine ligase
MIVFVTPHYEGTALARAAGGDVAWLYDWFAYRKVYDGLTGVHTDLTEVVRGKPEGIFLAGTDPNAPLGRLADTLRGKGYKVWGIGEVSDTIEYNRASGLAVMARMGIRIPKTLFFTPNGTEEWKDIKLDAPRRVWRVKGGVKEATEFVRESGERWVFKPQKSNESDLTYVAQGPDDMVAFLQSPGAQDVSAFLLQEYISGVEVSIEVWVQNGEILWDTAFCTMEVKRFGARDTGPATGCMASVVWAIPLSHRLATQTLARPDVRAWLKNPVVGGREYPPYSGPLDLNTRVTDDKKIYGLEWTPRFGYNSVYALLSLHDADWPSLFRSLAKGESPPPPKTRYKYAAAFRVSAPPWPLVDKWIPPLSPSDWALAEALTEDIVGEKLPGELMDHPHIYWHDVRVNGKRDLRIAGGSGVIADVTGVGDTIESARDAAWSLFDLLDIPNKYARYDGVDRAISDTVKLSTILGTGV